MLHVQYKKQILFEKHFQKSKQCTRINSFYNLTLINWVVRLNNDNFSLNKPINPSLI